MGRKHYWVYILASRIGGTLYIGITSDLIGRIYQHKTKQTSGFTQRYDVIRLVHFEQFDDPENAIRREKRLKKWNRARKIQLIEKENRIGTTSILKSQSPEGTGLPAFAGNDTQVLWRGAILNPS